MNHQNTSSSKKYKVDTSTRFVSLALTILKAKCDQKDLRNPKPKKYFHFKLSISFFFNILKGCDDDDDEVYV